MVKGGLLINVANGPGLFTNKKSLRGQHVRAQTVWHKRIDI